MERARSLAKARGSKGFQREVISSPQAHHFSFNSNDKKDALVEGLEVAAPTSSLVHVPLSRARRSSLGSSSLHGVPCNLLGVVRAWFSIR
jgi:hypothetical protein